MRWTEQYKKKYTKWLLQKSSINFGSGKNQYYLCMKFAVTYQNIWGKNHIDLLVIKDIKQVKQCFTFGKFTLKFKRSAIFEQSADYLIIYTKVKNFSFKNINLISLIWR